MEPPKISADALRAHVEKLAGEIGERNVFTAAMLARAADYIEQTWRTQGYQVMCRPYKVYNVTCSNLEIACRGKDEPNEIILVGARLRLGRGKPRRE